MYAVLTGDVVHSSKLKETRRIQLISDLEEVVQGYNNLSPYKEPQPLFYRGDSLQLIITEGKMALRIAYLLRCRVKMNAEHNEDVRIAIGLGDTKQLTKSIADSDGEAFRLSGRSFDVMKDEHLVVKTSNEHWNNHINVSLHLADTIINGWSKEVTEAVYYRLKGNTQTEIAQQFHVSQPAIHKRLKTGGYSSIERLIEHFEEAVKWI